MLVEGAVKALYELPRVQFDSVERCERESAVVGGLGDRVEHWGAVDKDLGAGAKATHILI